MAADEDHEHARPLQRRRLPFPSPCREARHRCCPSLRPQDGSHPSSPQDRCCPAPRHRPTRAFSCPPSSLLPAHTHQLVCSRSSLQNAVRHAIDVLLLYVSLSFSFALPLTPPASLQSATISSPTPRNRSTPLPRTSLPPTHSPTHSHPAMPPATLNSTTPPAPSKSHTPPATHTRPASPSSASLPPASSPPAPSSQNSRAPWPTSQTRRTGTSKRPASAQAISGATLVSSTPGP